MEGDVVEVEVEINRDRVPLTFVSVITLLVYGLARDTVEQLNHFDVGSVVWLKLCKLFSGGLWAWLLPLRVKPGFVFSNA